MPMVRARISPVPLLLLASLSWGLATALSKVALKHVTSLDLFAVDITLGAVFLSIVAFARGAMRYDREVAWAPRMRQGSPGVNFFTPMRMPGTA